MASENRVYYTYAYLREDRTPYYIGKGQGNRVWERKRKRIKPPRTPDRVLILKKNLTETEAFAHEIYMIFIFGRKDLNTGILRNKTNGGEGCCELSLDSRQKRSKALSEARRKSLQNPEYRAKISLGLRRYWKNKNLSKQELQKRGESGKGKIWCWNPDTGQTIRLKPEDILPPGYTPGRGPSKRTKK